MLVYVLTCICISTFLNLLILSGCVHVVVVVVAVLVVALVERWTCDRKVAGSTPGRGTIKSTRSTQPSIPPG